MATVTITDRINGAAYLGRVAGLAWQLACETGATTNLERAWGWAAISWHGSLATWAAMHGEES